MSVDLELKKAFQDLQSKMIGTTQQLKVSDMQIDQLNRQIQHSKLVGQDLQSLPKETKMYEGVGRMFLLQPAETVQQHLDEKIKSNEEKIKKIQTNKTYLERSIKESENSLRELIINKQKDRS